MSDPLCTVAGREPAPYLTKSDCEHDTYLRAVAEPPSYPGYPGDPPYVPYDPCEHSYVPYDPSARRPAAADLSARGRTQQSVSTSHGSRTAPRKFCNVSLLTR